MTEQITSHRNKVRALFDVKATRWPDKYGPNGQLTGRLTQFANAVAPHVTAGCQILDLGCGSGDLARHLAISGLRVTGCDIAAEMLVQATSADHANAVTWVQLDTDWSELPFGPGTFDAVISASVLEYVPSPEAFLRECARVLRPGAVMLATVPDMRHPVRWLEAAALSVALIPGACAMARRWPHLGAYMTYLRISRQRHTATWWAGAAARAGLLTVPIQTDPGQRAPLHLLTLQRADGGKDL